jgi:hypothetical protein
MQSKIYCFFGRHVWSVLDNNVCSVCGKVAVGLPKFVNPPEPPSPPVINVVEKYMSEFDSRFEFVLRNKLSSREEYEETKSFYVFKCLATHYNFSIQL